MRLGRRLLAMLLAMSILFSTVPTQAFATDSDSTEFTVVETVPEETTPETVPPKPTEPVVTEPVVTEPLVTEPVVTEPLVTEPVVTEPLVTEPVVTEPVVTEPVVTEPVVTEPEVTEPEVTEPEEVTGYFGINWTNTSHSGKVPNVAADVRVLDADGNTVDATVSKSGDGYAVFGLQSNGSYQLQLVPGENSTYAPAGDAILKLTYDSEGKRFTAGSFTASLDTYTLLCNVVWPEGITAPEGFDVALQLNGTDLELQEAQTSDGFVFGGLYEVDGDYTLVLPEVKDLTTDSYAVSFNSTTKQPLNLVYDFDKLTAEFVIFWSDRQDRLGYRSLETMEQMLTLSAAGKELTGFAINGQMQQESRLAGYEEYVYTVTGLPAGIGTELKLTWDYDALLCYSALDSIGKVKAIADFAPMTMTRASGESTFTSSKAYILSLPEYKVTLNVSGLADEDQVQQFLDGITVRQLDMMEGTETDYTGFWLSYSEGVVTIDGLTASVLYNDMGEWISIPGCYTVTWPAAIDGFDLEKDSDTELFVGRPLVRTFAAGGGAMTFSADVDYGAPSFNAVTTGTETENKTILWYDTTNNYNHGGQLTLTTSVTINGRTQDITLVPNDGDEETDNGEWDPAQNAYVYSFSGWTVSEFCTAFGIELYPGNLNPIDRTAEDKRPTEAEVKTWLNNLTLKVEDQGGNELNRTMAATISANLKVERTQFHETDRNYISYPVTVGEIGATAVTYTPAEGAEVRKYMLGSATIEGVEHTVVYPLINVIFDINVLTGDDTLEGIGTADSEFYKLAALCHMQIKEADGIIDMILAPDANGESYLEKRLNLIGDLGNSFVGGDLQGTNGRYTFLLPLYNEDKIQIEYAMSVLDEENSEDDDKKVDIGNDEYYFRVEYNNSKAPGHGTDLDRAYQGGRIILIRTGETSFTFNKYWVDGYRDDLTQEEKNEILAARPNATYELWRYPDKTNKETGVTGSYKTSANVLLPRQVTGVIPTFDPDASDPNHYTISFPADCLEKYDGEGYPYIYFIRETIPGDSGYEKFYGKVDADGNVTDDVLDTPYAEGATREDGDHSVYNNGNISNVKTDRISTYATKTWVGAYYQDRFDEVEVTMKLYRKLEGEADSTAEVHDTYVMDGFNAYNLTQTVGGSYDLYDENGRKYVYWWEEASVVQVDASGNPITVSDVPAGLSGIQSGNAINAKAGTAASYYLPMNAATMESDSYSPTSQEFFEVTSYVDEEGIAHFTNTLKGDTEYWIHKTWDSTLTPSDVAFPLLQINSNGSSTQWSEVFTLETEDYLNGEYDSGWHKGYVNLPKYDEDGNLYTYIARESSIDGILPITSYGYDVDGEGESADGEIEAQSVQIHNAPVGRMSINLRKIWLDDSANTDRTDVQLKVTMTVERTGADGEKIREEVTMYGPNGLYGSYVNLENSTDWIQTKDVTIYRVDGEYVTHLPENVTGQMPNLPTVTEGEEGGDGETTEPAAPVVESISIVSINVTEVSLGENGEALVDTQNTTPAGYPTVKYGDTTYAVFYNSKDGMNPTATTKMDEDEYYTVTNLRIGTTQLGVTKIWNDDGEVIREDYEAKIKVTSETEGRLKSENSLGYAKVHPAVVASGWTPVTGGTADTPTAADKTHVDLIQALPTGQDSRGTSFTSFIYYYDLPLYDEYGKILEYSVEELPGQTDENGGHYSMISTPLEYGDNSTASQYFGMQTVTNTFTNEAPVEFYLLWLDDYRESINLRPDMYLTLYYAEYEYDANGDLVLDENDEPVYTVKPYSYHEYSWEDATVVTENFWKYTFDGLPQYDSHGRKITYYATVGSHVGMGDIDYLDAQYAIGYVPSNSMFQTPGINQSTVNDYTLGVSHNNNYTTVTDPDAEDYLIRTGNDGSVVLHSENTFVLQLRSNVIVQGRKVWEQIPEGFPVSDLPLLSFLLKRELTEEEKKPENLSIFTPDADGRITLSAILDFRSPSQDYTFDMNYMGLLTMNSGGQFSIIPANTPIGEGENASTALDIWMDLAGIDAADRTKAEALYGRPLPKYDSYGTMYVYKVIESWVRPNNEGFMEENGLGVDIVLTYSLNEYKIVNSISMGKRPINVTKSWFRFDSSHIFSDVEDAVYPDMEFQLLRFVRIDNTNFEDSLTNPGTEKEPEYSEPILVETVKLTGAQVKAIVSDPENLDKIYAAFKPVEVYAPNGNPYHYVVAEKKIDGFNTENQPNIEVENAVKVPNAETGVNNWPEFTGDFWYSTPFKLTPAKDGDNTTVDTSAAAGTEFDNVYTAMKQRDITFRKQWEDYSNQFTTRPGTLSISLTRSFTYVDQNGNRQTRAEKIATFTITNAPGTDDHGKVSVAWESGFSPADPLASQENATGTVYKNLTSAFAGMERIKVGSETKEGYADLSGTNVWTLAVRNLDQFAPTGEEYKYGWKETEVPEGYTTTVTTDGLKNTLSTDLRVFKRWNPTNNELNSTILKPTVTVCLMVSDDGGKTWYRAETYDGGIMKTVLGETYKFDYVLDYPYWYTYYSNLPTGNDGKSLTYKVVEIAVNGVEQDIKNNPGWVVSESNAGNTSEIHNTLKTTDFTVTKIWVDDDNVFETRYLNGDGKWEVSYYLYRSTGDTLDPASDEQVMYAPTGSNPRPQNPQPVVLTVTGTDATSNFGSETIEGLPTHTPDGKAYTYYAVELNPDRGGGTSVGTPITGSRYDGTYGVTNSYTGSTDKGFTTTVTNDMHTVNLEVTKIWLDDAGYDGVRPGDANAASFPWDTLTLTLKQFGGDNDEAGKDITTAYKNSEGAASADYKWDVVTGTDDRWMIIFTGLPKNAPDGTAYTYEVEEAQVPGYQPGTDDINSPETEGNQAWYVKNRITKFRIEKIGKDNDSTSEDDVLRNVTMTFVGVDDHNKDYTIEWSSVIYGDSFYETYTITDPEGTETSSKISAIGQKVDIYGAPEGQYKISSETVIPDGYYAVILDTECFFTLQTDADGNQELVETSTKTEKETSGGLPELEVYNYKTLLKINKLGRTMDANGTLLSDTTDISDGWKFAVTGVFADSKDTDNDGLADKVETRYYTADNAADSDLWIGDLIADRNYTLKEVEHPDGYILKEDTTITFKINRVTNKVELVGSYSTDLVIVNDNGELNFKDDPFKLTVTKKSTESGNANLDGAQYKLYVLDETAMTMTEVTSSDVLTTSSGKFTVRSYRTNPKLKADNTTRYFLVETKAPDGYVLEDVEGPAGYTLPSAVKTADGLTHPWIIFHFTKAGVMVEDDKCDITERASSAAVTAGSNTVAFTDDPTKLYLHKHDNGDVFTHGPLNLDGITFQLKNSSGTVLGTVTTGTDGHIDFANLKNSSGNRVRLVGGQTYTLSEVKDAGYKQFADVTFKVETNGKISNITCATGSDFAASTPTDGRENSFFEIGNTREPGTMTLIKSSDFGNLSDVVFELYHYNPANSLWDRLYELLTGKTYKLAWTETGTSITDYNIVADESVPGKLILKNLPWGQYKLVEKAPKDGFLLAYDEIKFKIGRPDTDVFITKQDTLKNEDFPVEFTKYAATGSASNVTFTNETLEGARFKLQYQIPGDGWKNYDPIRYYTADENGKVTINSIEGDSSDYEVVLTTSPSGTVNKTWYRLTEIKAPDGYILPDSNPYVDFWIAQDGTVNYATPRSNFVSDNTFGDLPIKLTLTKFDLGDEYIDPHKYIKGTVKFTIVERQPNENGELVNTGRNGDLTMTDGVMNIGVGYDYYLVGGNSYTVTETQILENGKPITGYETLNSFTFKVETNGTISGLTFVDANGNAVSNSDTYGDVKYVASDATAMELYNQRKRGIVQLTKVDDVLDLNLNDAEFELRRKNDTTDWLQALADFITGNTYKLVWSTVEGSTSVSATLETSPKDGKLIISNLPWGTYQLVETKAPAGYELPVNEAERTHEFTIDATNAAATVSVDYDPVENTAAEKDFFKHVNTDGKAGAALKDAEFALTKSGSDTVLKTYTSDDSGKITVRSTGKKDGKLEVYIETSDSEADARTNGRIYRVTETKAPDGYELPGTAPYAEFWVDRQGEFHILNSAYLVDNAKFLDTPIKLTIDKYDSGDEYAPEHPYTAGTVKFTIVEDGTNRTGNLTLENGVLNIGIDYDYYLVGGNSYTVTEIEIIENGKTLSSYELLSAFTFTVTADGKIKDLSKTTTHGSIDNNGVDGIKVVNERKHGIVEVLKKDNTLNYPLNDAEFELRRTDDTKGWLGSLLDFITGNTYKLVWSTKDDNTTVESQIVSTPDDGKLVISNLPWGTYQLVETKAPAGYELPADESKRTYEFTIDQTNASTTLAVVMDPILNIAAEFNFFKHATANGTTAGDALPGAEFKLHKAREETALQTYTSDANGKITVRSTGLVNGQLVVYIETSSSYSEAVANGRVYRITETKAPVGYELPATAPFVEFWVDKAGEIRPVTDSEVISSNKFLDKPIELTLRKYDSGDQFADETLYTAGRVKFLIKKIAPTAEATATEVTMENGVLKLGVDHGYAVEGGATYQLTEQQVTGYEVIDSFTFKVDENGNIIDLVTTTAKGSIAADGTTGIKLVNQRIPGSVKLTKKDLDLGYTLNDAEFELRRKDEADTFGKWFQQLITGKTYTVVWDSTDTVASMATANGSQGVLTIEDLPWGTYQLVETKAPNGYKLPANEADRIHEFTIDASTITLGVDIGFVDNDSFAFDFYKHASSNGAAGAALSGAQFMLHVAGTDTAMKTYTSDSNGKITVKSAESVDNALVTYLKVSTSLEAAKQNGALYRITETKAPVGYELPSPAPYVEFWINTTGEIRYVSSNSVESNTKFLDLPIELSLSKFDAGDRYDEEAPYTGEVKFLIKKTAPTAEATATEVTMTGGVLELGVDHGYTLEGGATYELTEQRVTGYEAISTFTFKVEEDGTLSNLVKTTDHGAIAEDGTTGIKLVNDRLTGSVKLTKVDADLNLSLDGAMFDLYREGDNGYAPLITGFATGTAYVIDENGTAQLDTAVTAAKGELIISGLAWGNYQLVESKAPAGYKLPSDESSRIHGFTIYGTTVETVQLNKNVDNSRFSFDFYKFASANGTTADADALSGAAFMLHVAGTDTALQTYTSGADGKFTVLSAEKVDGVLKTYLKVSTSLEEARTNGALYRITETAAPIGYELSSPAPYVEFWVNTVGEIQYVSNSSVAENTKFLDKPIELTLEKWDAGDEFTDPAKYTSGNVVFTIEEVDSDEESVEITAVNGTFTFSPKKGSYMVEQGKTYKVTEKRVTGYEVVSIFTFTVEANGTISNLTTTTEHGSIAADGTDGIKVTNDRIPGKVKLTKWDEELNVNLNGAEFELRRKETATTFGGWLSNLLTGNAYKVIWTNGTASTATDTSITAADGELYITNLPWGEYQLVETKAPAGYKLPAKESDRIHGFAINASNTEAIVDLSFVDNDSFEFTFNKFATTDGESIGKALPGAQFMLHLPGSDNAIATYVSDTNGTFTVKSAEVVDDELVTYLQVSTSLEEAVNYKRVYRITETKAPAGYELPDTAPYVEFWIDADGDIQYTGSNDVKGNTQFLDEPIELTLIKYDGGDRCTEARYTFTVPENFTEFDKLGKLDGITFQLTDDQGQVQTAVTEDGMITFGPAETDDFFVIGGRTYTLTEADAESMGYVEVAPFTFTINEDGTITLPDNTPAAVTKDAAATGLRVVNDRILGCLTLNKTTVDGDALDGIVFNLYRENVPATLLDKLFEFITGTTYTLTDSFVWGEDAALKITAEDGTQTGVLTIQDLDWGSYKLVETYADGYILDEDEATRTYTFEIGPANTEQTITLDAKLDVTNTPNRLVVHKVEEDKSSLLVGAEYELHYIGEDGSVTKITNTTDDTQPKWVWNSNTGTGEATRLNIGTYQLVETRSPFGYVIADSIVFTMDQQGNVEIVSGNGRLSTVSETDQTPLLLAEDKLTMFEFNKAALINETCYEFNEETKILPGVTFAAYTDPQCTEESKIATAVSDEDGVVTFYGLPLKDYMGAGTSTPVYIRETATVEGYVLDTTVYMVYVDSVIDSDGSVISKAVLMKDNQEVPANTVINDVRRGDFIFTKVSELDNGIVIPGGEYGLYKTFYIEVGSVKIPYELQVATAVSDENGIVIFEGLLMDTEYTVRELSVPTGSYLSANEITFKLVWSEGHAVVEILNDGNGTITDDGSELLWQEPQVVVSILKTDSRGNALAGATLQIRDEDGNVIPVYDENGDLVKSWVSTRKAFVVASQLEASKTYWLYELEAPIDYIKSRRVKFVIPEDAVEPGEELVIKVTMKNYHRSELPKTGDESMFITAMGTMLTSGAVLMSLLLLSRNKNRLAWLLAYHRNADKDRT